MACGDLCTAQKCAELEQRIAYLEDTLYYLNNAFQTHINENIPKAHNYTPLVLVESFIEGNNILTTSVTIDDINDFDKVNLPINKKSNLNINGSFQSEILNLTIADGESEGTANILIPIPEHKESDLSLNGNFEGNTLNLTIADGESEGTANILIPLTEPEQCNLNINGSYFNEIITITYSYCNGSNSFQIPISIGNEITNIINNNNYSGGGENLDCSNIETKIDDCCTEILNAINQSQINVTNEINNSETVIVTDVSEVKDAVCIDITGEVNSDYSCKFPEDEDGNIKPTYAQSNFNIKEYSDKGFGGIHKLLKLISVNMDAMHNDICKAVDPMHTITLEDMYNFCNDSGIKREDFTDNEEGEIRYNKALNAYFLELQKDSKYGHLIPDSQDANNPASIIDLITAPTNWTNYILTDFNLIQSRINRNIICNLDLPEMPDVVTIVASEKDVHRVKTKSLVLHFVTLDAYPKRTANQSYRPTQIPAAKEAYDWVADFEDLRWTQGNQYAELRFVEPYVSVSGWFVDVDAANVYFDKVLTLTTATEDNRVFTKHSNPKTDYLVRETRPYRAFIVSVNEKREKLCHAKYVPVIEEKE